MNSQLAALSVLRHPRGANRDGFRAGGTEWTLESQQEFYENVYKPRRDTLSKEWSERFGEKSLTLT
jgi:hypothetical protein